MCILSPGKQLSRLPVCLSGGLNHFQTGIFSYRKELASRGANCTARQCCLIRRKFQECSINNQAPSLLMKHLVIDQRKKAPNFSAFHWSPHGSLVSIGQHFVTMRVVHLPKRTETSLITKSDKSGPNHQLLQLCTACTVWSDSDQTVRPCIAAVAGSLH